MAALDQLGRYADHGYARECLKLAEEADSDQTRQKLIDLSRVWMEAALQGEAAANKQMTWMKPP